MQIMELIWGMEKSVTTADIMQHLPIEVKWKQSTVVTFLTRLIEKGILKATRIGKANYYEPCITEQEYKDYATRQFIEDIHKGSMFGFISTLFNNGDLTKEDIESLKKYLKE